MIAAALRWLFRRPRPAIDAEYGRAVDQQQVERTRDQLRALRMQRELYAGLESLRGEAGLYDPGGRD